MAADFNGDGRIDLAVNCHTRHGDHRTLSRISYNDGQRFENPEIQKLPTTGPHLIWAEDVGHLYHRKYRQAYESRAFHWNEPRGSGTIVLKGTTPTGTRLETEVRAAPAADALSKAHWQQVEDGRFALAPEDRVVQYRAIFHSDNGDRYPVLDRVEIGLKK
jgi:hypothetical protein